VGVIPATSTNNNHSTTNIKPSKIRRDSSGSDS
jgi:hypothetical protein